jgi:hypothetical protein
MARVTCGRLSLDTERSRAARALAQDALVTLVHELGDLEPPMILLGGLVPDILTGAQTPPVPEHLGTIDVDILLDVQVAADAELGAIERALLRLGFASESLSSGWRWSGNVRGATVKLEFLCELDDQPTEAVIRAGACKQLGAMNLRGTGYVREDWQTTDITGALPNGTNVTLPVRVAALGGYLLAKATALHVRSKEKDYYDFAYVLIYNREGGPAQAAALIRRGKLGLRVPALRTLWSELAVRFADTQSGGAVAYAQQAKAAHPESNTAQLKNDAVTAVAQFLGALGVT